MAIKTKIDSNATGLRYSEELSIGTVDPSAVWIPMEPNSYDNFGGEVTKTPREPITASRQNKKGVTTDLDAAGGLNQDFTQSNMQDLLQGFFFADTRVKHEFGGASAISNVDGTSDEYDGTSVEANLAIDDLIFAAGFAVDDNNGLKIVTNITGPDTLGVAEVLLDEVPPADATIAKVGVQTAADDLGIDATGSLPLLTSSTLDFTTLGLIPGEWMFIGGDLAADQFVNAENNGFARIKTIATNAVTLDKTQDTMITEVLSGGEVVRLFFGRVLKNESDPTLQVRRTYQIERTLGAPDDTQPAQIQAEYLVGAVGNEVTINMETADKINTDLGFLATDHETISGPDALKAGTRPDIEDADAFNTSSDFSRLKMNIVDPTNSNPTSLFGFLLDFNVKINNGIKPNKAISVLGSFEMSAGNFTVTGDLTAYFSEVAAIAAVRNNDDITMDFAIVANNAGVMVDIPLMGLGDGRLNVEKDEPITIPLTQESAGDPTLDHTLLMVFFDYLPTAAE